MSAPSVYISIDWETVHPDPFAEGAVNFGAVAYVDEGKGAGEGRRLLSSFSINIVPKHSDPATVEWWNADPARKAIFTSFSNDAVPTKEAMEAIRTWMLGNIKGYKNSCIVAMPTIFDGTLLYAFWLHYLGHPTGGKGPGFTFIDVRSYGAGVLGVPIWEANKGKAFTPFQPVDEAHTHKGEDDAKEQLLIYFALMDHAVAKK